MVRHCDVFVSTKGIMLIASGDVKRSRATTGVDFLRQELNMVTRLCSVHGTHSRWKGDTHDDRLGRLRQNVLKIRKRKLIKAHLCHLEDVSRERERERKREREGEREREREREGE
jgi:hypothetical protein